MKRWIKIVVIVFIAALAGIQFVQPARNIALQSSAQEISAAFPVPVKPNRSLSNPVMIVTATTHVIHGMQIFSRSDGG